MNIKTTPLAGVFLVEPKVFGDERGFFFESFNEQKFYQGCGFTELEKPKFVQDNHSRSSLGILRGLHYQMQQPQGKLVRVAEGAVYDVVVDIRKYSPTFGQSFGVMLTAQNHLQLYVPVGFAHGFIALSERVDFLYKTTDYYAPEHERCILWNDPVLKIDWPLHLVGGAAGVKVNARDAAGKLLVDADYFA